MGIELSSDPGVLRFKRPAKIWEQLGNKTPGSTVVFWVRTPTKAIESSSIWRKRVGVEPGSKSLSPVFRRRCSPHPSQLEQTEHFTQRESQRFPLALPRAFQGFEGFNSTVMTRSFFSLSPYGTYAHFFSSLNCTTSPTEKTRFSVSASSS